jgi:cytochrome P450
MGTAAPGSEVDLWSDESLHEPWAGYRSIRDAAPVVELVKHGLYAIARYADVKRALRDWETFTSAQGVSFNEFANSASPGTAPASDPPEHTQIRGAMLQRLKLSEIRGLQDRLQAKADRLVTELLERGSFDVVPDVAQRFVVESVGELVGISGEVLERFGSGGHEIFNIIGPDNERLQTSLPGAVGLLQLAHSLTKADMVPGGMGWDLFEAEERGLVPPNSSGNLIFNYLGPGFDTTIGGLGSTIWLLATHQDQWERLRKDPSLAAAAFNEGLRLESPINLWSRVCRPGAEVDGVEIPAGARVAILLGAANRDERHYDDPDTFDIDRNPQDHLAFGSGIHLCVGAPLARAQGTALLTALARQATVLECGEPVRRLNNITRALGSLPTELR